MKSVVMSSLSRWIFVLRVRIRPPSSDLQMVKAPGVFTEKIGFFRGGESLGCFDRLDAVPIHVAVRVVAGVHESLAAELIDN